MRGLSRLPQEDPVRRRERADKTGETRHRDEAFLPLQLPSGQEVLAEVDTGSQTLILDQRFMASLGISPSDPGVKRRDGQDETGHNYTRYFAKITGAVHFKQQPSLDSTSPEVMLQKIIYNGLVGHFFLKQFSVTYNFPNAEMIFRNP